MKTTIDALKQALAVLVVNGPNFGAATQYVLRKAIAREEAKMVEPVAKQPLLAEREELRQKLLAARNMAVILRERELFQEAAEMLAADASWEQVARAQDAKLRAMVDEPGGIEKLREVLAQAAAKQS